MGLGVFIVHSSMTYGFSGGDVGGGDGRVALYSPGEVELAGGQLRAPARDTHPAWPP
jgi:hypothetical protein